MQKSCWMSLPKTAFDFDKADQAELGHGIILRRITTRYNPTLLVHTTKFYFRMTCRRICYLLKSKMAAFPPQT